MKKRAVWLLLFVCLASCANVSSHQSQTILDRSTADKIDDIIRDNVIPHRGAGHGELIASVSSAFLSTPYKADTLIGSADSQEVLVADFNGVDCVTLIDYVEALTQAKDQKTFLNRLIATRYAQENISFYSRKHFFTDWFAIAPYNAVDVTRTISPAYLSVNKRLNHKPDGGEYIAGLGVIAREINYIPAHAIGNALLDNLKNGDYVGVYSKLPGLDVSHTGIVIKSGGEVWFRHASSLARNQKVVDVSFAEYMTSKPGFIVLRAK